MKTSLSLFTVGLAALAGFFQLSGPSVPPVLPLTQATPEGALVALSGGLSHRAVLAGETNEVFLSVNLAAVDPPGLQRQRMNLALVIDRSGSMASERKLEFAKSAADQLVSRLRPDDRLAIVTYDEDVETVVSSRPARNRDVFHASIDAIRTGGSTNLHGGMVAGYVEVTKAFDPAAANRVLLLSDGLANAGIDDPGAIRERASRCRAEGVRIATMGMGLSYDEDLMSAIAEEAGGQYHYIDDPEGLGDYLERELEQLGRVVAKDVKVLLRLAPGVELNEVYGYGHRQAGDTVEVAMADLLAGERRKLVLRLAVGPGAMGERPVASVSLRCTDAGATVRQDVELAPLGVRGTKLAADVREQRDLGVLAQAEVVRNAQVLDEAMRRQRAGDVDRARTLLLDRYTASAALNASEYHSDDVSRILMRMKTVAEQLEQTRANAPAARDLQLRSQLQALGYMR